MLLYVCTQRFTPNRPYTGLSYRTPTADKARLCLLPDNRCFTKHRLSGLNNRKHFGQFPGSSAAVIPMTAIPPRRAHGTLQPFGMKVS